jgi:hypothetical protein
LAVVATLSKGYDLDYIWKQVDASLAREGAGYYIQASETGGEPPGRWWGPGAQALGLQPGHVVERKPYDLLFGERKAPDGTQLGRPPGSGRKAADIYVRLLAAEPHATAERKRELRLEATRQARQSPLFFDLTLSLSKSISIFHASLGENVRLARQAGDAAGEAYWSGLVAEVDAMIWQAVRAGFGYFQREAGYTRTGSHNTRVNGRETGQWHEAGLAVAHWLQHTSRDGDMQLHVHSQIAHVARTATDGKWRAPDSLGYNEHVGAVGAITAQHLEEALTRRFGLEWAARDDGHGFEVEGVSGEMMRVFSSRRESITADLRARAARFEQQYGRAPSQRELAQLAQASNFATRKNKDGALDAAQLHAGWADKLARTLGVPLASVAPSVWHADAGRADARLRDANAPGAVPDELVLSRAAQQAVALAQREKSTWTRADLVKYLGRVLPRTGRDPAQAAALLEDLADRALRSEFEPVLCLEAPEPAEVPRSLLRADGRSVHRRHGGVRYAMRTQLTMEELMLAEASAQTAPRMTRAAAAQALGADPERLVHALEGRATDADGTRRTGSGLREEQAAATLSVLSDGRRASVINAPAGSGKTRVLAEVARAWKAAGLGPVIGITTSQSARNTLAAGVPESYNSAQFLGHLPGQRGARDPVPIAPGTLLVIDDDQPGPGRPHQPGRGPRREGDRRGGHQSTPSGTERRRHGSPRRPPGLCPPDGAGPVPRTLGTGREPAAARRRHHGPGRVRRARPDHRRGPGADDGRRRSRLRRPCHRGDRHAADGRRPCPAAGTVPPHPRRPAPPRPRPRPGGADRRRRDGRGRGPDRVHPQRPSGGSGGARPAPGQRGPAAHRRHHCGQPAGSPCPGRRQSDRAASLDGPAVPVRALRRR